jgi:hypothetical protein
VHHALFSVRTGNLQLHALQHRLVHPHFRESGRLACRPGARRRPHQSIGDLFQRLEWHLLPHAMHYPNGSVFGCVKLLLFLFRECGFYHRFCGQGAQSFADWGNSFRGSQKRTVSL